MRSPPWLVRAPPGWAVRISGHAILTGPRPSLARALLLVFMIELLGLRRRLSYISFSRFAFGTARSSLHHPAPFLSFPWMPPRGTCE